MALIRHAQAREIAREAIVLDLGDVQQQAVQIMEQAKRRAEAIIAEAGIERQRIIAGASEQGHAEGLAKGTELGRKSGADQGKAAAIAEWKARLELLDKRWTEAVAAVESQRDQLIAEARVDVLRLSILIAEKVVKRSIAVNSDSVVTQLQAVLALVARSTELLVSVNPADRATAESAMPSLLARFQSVRHIELVDDASLAPGSCVARTRASTSGAGSGGSGVIDASVDGQLARIAEILLPDAPRNGTGETP